MSKSREVKSGGRSRVPEVLSVAERSPWQGGPSSGLNPEQGSESSRTFGSEAGVSEPSEVGSDSNWLSCCCRVRFLVWDLVCRGGRSAAGVLLGTLPLALGHGLDSGSGSVSGWS